MSAGFTAAAYMDKAQRAVEGARVLLGTADTEGACSRAYYAMFDAAHAVLLALAGDVPEASTKTHHGLISAFGRLLVQTGHVDASLGRSLNQVQHLRQLADYVGDPVTIEDAAWAVAQAEAFVAAMQAKASSGT